MLAMLLALSLGAPGIKEKADPATDIIGLWELERTEGGSAPPFQEERAGPLRWRFYKDGTFTVLEGDREVVGARTVKVDGAAKPATLDITISSDSSELVLGIFKIEGDKLTMCNAYPGKDRPTKFEAAVGETGQRLKIFRRVKPKN